MLLNQRTPKKNQGFALLEVLMVIAILLLLVSFVFARGRSSQKSLDLAAGKLAGVIRLGHTLTATGKAKNGVDLFIDASSDGLTYRLKQDDQKKSEEEGVLPRNIEFYIINSKEYSSGQFLGAPRSHYKLSLKGISIKSENKEGMTLILKDKKTKEQRVMTIIPTSGRVIIRR